MRFSPETLRAEALNARIRIQLPIYCLPEVTVTL
jgi:hypothetical protein